MPQPDRTLKSVRPAGLSGVAFGTITLPNAALPAFVHSPLMALLLRLQSTTRLSFASVQLRFVLFVSLPAGLALPVKLPPPWPATYLLRLTLTAVLPSPLRSYAAP